MRQPLHLIADVTLHQLKNGLRRNARYPMVLMLEPLWTCNLACIGCSKERHTGKLKDRLSVASCLRAADACGAPTVSICGGEATLYPELPELIAGLVERRRHIFLCTNALRLDSAVFDRIPPQRRLSINVHLDGMRETHDYVTGREGVFDTAIAMTREAKRRGYHVMANTTIYKETRLDEVERLCGLLAELGVDGILVTPGYQYDSVTQQIFLTDKDMQAKFRRVLELSKRYRLASTPQFLEFAAGLREYSCSPWSTVTYTPRGWKGPCYLIGERFTHDFDQFWRTTDWAYWESRRDRRCRNCRMHSGFETSVLKDARRNPRELARLVRWSAS